MHRIGIDLGGSKIEGIVLSDVGEEIFRERIQTQQEKGYQHILSRIHIIYRNMLKIISGEAHTFGIGTPGSISKKTGLLKNSNTLCLNGKPLKRDLDNLLGRETIVENDANCFAMAEAILGAGKGKDLVFGVIIGSGCGGGIIYKQKLIAGLQHIAGEWGHMSIDPNGPECYCGSYGCIETYISGGGLENRYYDQYGIKLSSEQIIKMYYGGDKKSRNTIDHYLDYYGRAMANLINVLDPDLIVIGGGVSNFTELYSTGISFIKKYIFNDELSTPIIKNKLGDSAGVIGAALMGI